ncbi:MAG: type II CRISPR RNA-guided endonuclease Cas9 [Dialister sp.]
MNYVLGLDVGITSCGWAVLELNHEDEPVRIVDLNSRIFDKAEAGNGDSLAAPRRMARGIRRLTRRRKFRLHRVRGFLVRHHILTKEEIENLYTTPHKTDIYELRYRALTEKVSPSDWARLLIFFAKHRGFQSNRKNEKSGEDGLMLAAIGENKKILENYRSVGDMLYSDEKFKDCKRNKGGTYRFTVSRSMLKEEVQTLFKKQRELGQTFAGEDLEDEYISIFSAQRNFDEGPGANSPYAGDQIEKMIGNCTFEDGKNDRPPQKRAPKASYAFMAFNLWQKINHIRVNCKGIERSLETEEKNKIAGLAWTKENITYHDLRQITGLDEETRFSEVTYPLDSTTEEAEKKVKFSWVKPYHAMRRALDKVEKNYIRKLSREEIDAIAYAFTVYKNDKKIRTALAEKGIEDNVADVLITHLDGFSKFGHLSEYACYKLLPFLEKGEEYYKACDSAGLTESPAKKIKDITNPVVKRAVTQTMKVIKAVQRKYGNPVEVHIELARELARSFKDRAAMDHRMKENYAKNEKIKERLSKEFHIMNPRGQDIVKWKLYEQQQGCCAYSQKPFDVDRLLHDGNYAEVDHILPYSRSFDDTYRNKVLVLEKENRDKGNRTPMEYLADKPERKEKFIAWVKTVIKDSKKREHLLRVKYGRDEEAEWKQRHLQDTQYISRFLYNYLRNTLKLAPGYTDRKRRIIPVNGAVTGYIRKRLGIHKIRENGDLHHAVDAVVIAATTQGMIQKVTRYSQIKENVKLIDKKTGEVLIAKEFHNKDNFPEPWPRFRQELEARVSEDPEEAIRRLRLPAYENAGEIKKPFVSRMPRRKVRGAAHEETVRSGKLREDGYTILKTDLSKLRLENGEIKGYYRPESDRLLYEALKKRLEAFGGKGEEAFKEPFYKPKADGTPGPLVKKVKIIEKSSLNVPVHKGKGVAYNDMGVRIDIFGVNGKGKTTYYLVPVYVSDTVKTELPCRAVVAKKPYEEWKVMDDKDFLFSLYPNDMIHVVAKRNLSFTAAEGSNLPPKMETKDAYVYYKGADINGGTITVITHDNSYEKRGFGIKMLLQLEKCEVDVLGNISFVKQEKRQGFR